MRVVVNEARIPLQKLAKYFKLKYSVIVKSVAICIFYINYLLSNIHTYCISCSIFMLPSYSLDSDFITYKPICFAKDVNFEIICSYVTT